MSEMSNLSAYKASFFSGDIDAPGYWYEKLTDEEKAQVESPYDWNTNDDVAQELWDGDDVIDAEWWYG